MISEQLARGLYEEPTPSTVDLIVEEFLDRVIWEEQPPGYTGRMHALPFLRGRGKILVYLDPQQSHLEERRAFLHELFHIYFDFCVGYPPRPSWLGGKFPRNKFRGVEAIVEQEAWNFYARYPVYTESLFHRVTPPRGN